MIEMDRHIEILLLNNDCVIVPGYGGFMAHHVTARRDENDGSILPPMRTIGFNQKLILNDSLLAQSYVEAYDISYPDAMRRIEDEVRELRQRIDIDGQYEFRDLGVISLNKDGNYEFEPCPAGILTPELYGLAPVEITPLSQLKTIDILSEEDKQNVDIVQEDIAETESVIEDFDNNSEKHSARFVALWRNVAAACIVVLAFLLFPTSLSDNRQLKSGIDTQLLNRVMPQETISGQDSIKKLAQAAFAKKKQATQQLDNAETLSPTATQSHRDTAGYTIVIASRVTRRNAQTYTADLNKRGYDQANVYTHAGKTKVIYGLYTTREEALKVLNRLHNIDEFNNCWITYLK